MNAKLLSRLIESIMTSDSDSLMQIAETIIEEEKKNGHVRLAKQLDDIVISNKNKQPQETGRPSADNVISGGLTALPVSRRYNQTLATMIPREKLKHHMVLCPDLEKRFDQIEKEYAAKERLKKHNLKPRTKILLYILLVVERPLVLKGWHGI